MPDWIVHWAIVHWMMAALITLALLWITYSISALLIRIVLSAIKVFHKTPIQITINGAAPSSEVRQQLTQAVQEATRPPTKAEGGTNLFDVVGDDD